MATYKEIKGVTVQTRAEDPVQNVGSWSSGANLPANINSGMGFGTQTASVIGGGYNGSTYSNNVYEYDGTSWTSGGSLTASLGQARTGHGILTAGGAVAGYKTSGNTIIANYEQYDGTSFTEQNDLNTARQTLAAAGSTTAALAVGGTTGVGPGSTQEGLTNVESYNGSSWTETTENNTARKQATSFSGGPAPTMIYIGGASDSTLYANVETYNGSAWTETTDLNTARSALAGAGQAQTDGLVFGGAAPSVTAATESWNGTTWTELNDLGTARHSLVGSGTGAASALAAGGGTSALTEEFSFPPPTAAILTEGSVFLSGGTTLKGFGKAAGIPGATWASGGDLNTGRTSHSGTGVQTANIVFGGATPPTVAITEVYNGTSWTEVNDLPAGKRYPGRAGTTTAALSIAGYPGSGSGVTNVESWDGTNWTETTDVNNARYGGGSAGTQTSAVFFGGFTTTVQAHTEVWDGTSWTETTNMNSGRYVPGSFGASGTSALGAGGYPGPSPSVTANVETWDGSAWTEVNNLNTARYGFDGGGNVSIGMVNGGYNPSYSALTETWNGTSFTEQADMATARNNLSNGANAVAGLATGGSSPPTIYANTEEFTADNALSTVTVS